MSHPRGVKNSLVATSEMAICMIEYMAVVPQVAIQHSPDDAADLNLSDCLYNDNTFTWSDLLGVAGYTEARAVGEAVVPTGPLRSLAPCNHEDCISATVMPEYGQSP
jgi:hypothetical protein